MGRADQSGLHHRSLHAVQTAISISSGLLLYYRGKRTAVAVVLQVALAVVITLSTVR
jgi:hypothetical protein